MKKLTKKEALRKQTTFKNILLIMGMVFLILSYATYMELNFKQLDKHIGLIVAISVIPLTVELISMYLKGKEKKDEYIKGLYKTYINIIIPIVTFLFTRYFYYYASSTVLDFKINAIIAIVPSIMMAVYTKSIIGILMVQILNVGILASCNLGEGYVYPILSILVIVFSLVYFIYNMNLDLEKNSKNSSKVSEIESYEIVKEVKLFKNSCIRTVLAISIILLIYGLIKAVFAEVNLFNISSILLVCGILNVDFIKNKFKYFPKVYSMVYKVALIFLISVQIYGVYVPSIDAITVYVNPILLLLSAHLLIGCSKEYKENLEVFMLQILVVATPLISCASVVIATMTIMIVFAYLLLQAFRKGEEEKYLIYIMATLFWPVVSILTHKVESNLEVLEYLVISIIYFGTYSFIKKLTNQK